MTEKYDVKCGKCHSEYKFRMTTEGKKDTSCPVCGNGKMLESKQIPTGKQMLNEEVCRHKFPSIWHGVLPPTCSKCGKSAESTNVLY